MSHRQNSRGLGGCSTLLQPWGKRGVSFAVMKISATGLGRELGRQSQHQLIPMGDASQPWGRGDRVNLKTYTRASEDAHSRLLLQSCRIHILVKNSKQHQQRAEVHTLGFLDGFSAGLPQSALCLTITILAGALSTCKASIEQNELQIWPQENRWGETHFQSMNI